MDPQSPEPLAPQPHRFPLLPSLLVLLLGISTGFLGYQNWQLRKEITSLKSLPSLTPTPTIDPVINWKTYTNSDYGFSFKYPNNWVLVDNPMPDTTSTITKDKKPHQINVNNEIGETMMVINPELPLGYGSPFTKSADILDKKRVDVYTYGSSPTKHNTNFGLSAFPNFSIDTYGNAPELDQILSTFRFLEQSQTTNTSDWKIYTNEKYSFSVDYPNDWVIEENPVNDPRAAKNSIRLTNNSASIYISIFNEYGGACPSEYQKIAIGSQTRDVCVGETEREKSWEQITFQKNGYTIELRGYATKTTPAELIVPQILSTFRFFGQTENWKTYTNDSYKITFQYPPNLEMEINQVYSRNYIEFIFDKNSPNPFTIKASTKYPANQTKYLIDTGPYGSRNIGDNVWDMYSLSLDEGLQLEKNNVLYSVIYPPSRETTVNQILSTFQFTSD